MTSITGRKRPTICLAASGGGHVRQLLDLEPFWRDYPHFFVTEDTALGRSIAAEQETHFVPHFALGQARLGSPLRMLLQAGRSLLRSLAIVGRRRPDVIITTGAGSQLFVVVWGRLFGAKVVLVDSFARFDRPSAFASLAGRFAHRRYSQSAEAAKHWPGALVVDPLKPLDTSAPEKEDLLFATVGATLPFDRLTGLVARAKKAGTISETVVLQAGETSQLPEPQDGMRIVRSLTFDEIRDILRRARIVVCHGGTGSIITALQQHCSVIVIPRSFALGEHYDNHQVEITESLEKRGLILSASDEASFTAALDAARKFTPMPVTTNYTDLIRDLLGYIEEEFPSRS